MSAGEHKAAGWTHLDERGAARMVDVTAKPESVREARAEALLRMRPDTRQLFADQALAKGDALAVARVAGIMAAKRTSSLIPLAHPIAIEAVSVDFTFVEEGIRITARVRTRAATGVEMEALTAVAVAALALYDMGKAHERGMRIADLRLVEKRGGASGHWRAGDGEKDGPAGK